jgi:Flp pilus assembly protein TadD
MKRSTSNRRQPVRTDQRLRQCVACGLALGICVVFAPACSNGFVNYDDEAYVTANRQVRAGLTLAGAKWAVMAVDAANWHPLSWLSLQIDAQIYGTNPFGFHLTNVLIHTANALLLFGFLASATDAIGPSLFVALLFGLHPLRAESVAWVSERKDVLCGLFFMLCLYAYQRFSSRPSTARYLALCLVFVLGLGAKPMLVTLPVVLLLLDTWPLARTKRWPWQQLLVEKMPLVGLACLSSWQTFQAQERGQAILSAIQSPIAVRFGNSLIATLAYLEKFFWPTNLAAFYPYPVPDGFIAMAVLAACVLVLVSFAVWQQRNQRPYLLVGWLWYLVTLVPVIGLVQVGLQGMADRYTYLPMIGIAIMIAWLGAELLRPVKSGALAGGAAVGVVVMVCSTATWKQVQYWHDSLTLWQHALRATDRNFMAEYLLGLALIQESEQETNRQHPMGQSAEAEWTRTAKRREAIAHYYKAVDLQPSQPEIHYALARALAEERQTQEAIREYQRAIACNSAYAQAHTNLAILYRNIGEAKRAEEHFDRALAIDSAQMEAHYNLGLLLLEEGRPSEAIIHFKAALASRPDISLIREALDRAQKAIQSAPADAGHK